MSSSHVTAFDRTLQKTHGWLEVIATNLEWEDHEQAYSALRSVLHALRDRLTPEEASDLGAQMPMLVRGFYYDGWHPSDKPMRYRHKQEFLDRVAAAAPSIKKEEIETLITTVFHCLSNEISDGEIAQVRDQLPQEIRDLWA